MVRHVEATVAAFGWLVASPLQTRLVEPDLKTGPMKKPTAIVAIVFRAFRMVKIANDLDYYSNHGDHTRCNCEAHEFKSSKEQALIRLRTH
jgi:hypothetical protein